MNLRLIFPSCSAQIKLNRVRSTKTQLSSFSLTTPNASAVRMALHTASADSRHRSPSKRTRNGNCSIFIIRKKHEQKYAADLITRPAAYFYALFLQLPNPFSISSAALQAYRALPLLLPLQSDSGYSAYGYPAPRSVLRSRRVHPADI